MHLDYIVRRLIQSLAVLVGVTLVVFFLTEAAGDPVLLMLAGTGATEHQLQQLRHERGYDLPATVRYAKFLFGVIQGDTGKSLRFNQPALPLVLDRFPATLALSFMSLLLALIVALPGGVISAVKRGKTVDHAVHTLVLVGQAMPTFWFGILLVLAFAVRLGWFPAGGYGTWRHAVLPTVALGLFPMARIARLTRSSMLEVLGQDFIRTARAKGLAERVVLYRHALRNALIPVVTVIALMFGSLLGGAVVTETIFSWPGVGLLAVQAIYNRDFPVVQSVVLVVAAGFVAINLMVDIVYTVIDPRIRLR